MTHLDSNALAQLIGAMAEVVSTVDAPLQPPVDELPGPLAEAIATFDAGWRPPGPSADPALAAQVDRLATAGMAFLEGDPMTAGQLLDAPIDTPAPPSCFGEHPRSSPLHARIEALQALQGAARHAAADLTGRQLARRGFSGIDECIAAFRDVADGYQTAADALTAYAAGMASTEGRRRLIQELLVDDASPKGTAAPANDGHLARLLDEATTLDDEASASVARCVATIQAATPGDRQRATIHFGIARSLHAVRGLLAQAAAAERDDQPRAAQGSAIRDARSAA